MVRRKRDKRKVRSVSLRFGTLNVGTITGKSRELADMMEKRKVDILCMQETRWKGSKARNIGGGYKLFYHDVDGKRNRVGVKFVGRTDPHTETRGESGILYLSASGRKLNEKRSLTRIFNIKEPHWGLTRGTPWGCLRAAPSAAALGEAEQ